MKKQNSQKGVLLLCTLIIMVILSVALMVGVWRMNSSVSTTKRAIWDIRAYWATKAGNTIAADGCLRSREWPNKDFQNTFNNYKVKHENTVIKGEDTTCDGSFSIYYINHLYNDRNKNFSSNNVAEVSLQPIFNSMKQKYQEKDDLYQNRKSDYDSALVQYKEAVAEYKQAVAEYKTALANNSEAEKKKEKEMLAKKSDMIYALSIMQNKRDAMCNCITQELYTLTVGKSGPYIAGMELVYGINPTILSDQNGIVQDNMSNHEAVKASAAAFVSGTIDITTNKILKINQSSGSRPCMIAKEVKISNGGKLPNPDSSEAIDIGNGTIFTDKCTINTQEITPGHTNSNLLKYGINVFPLDKINLKVAQVKEENANIQYTLPSGTFCFIEVPDKYTEEEFRATCNSVKELYFGPSDFKDLYIHVGENLLGFFLDLVTFSGVTSDGIETKYCEDNFNADAIFNEYFSAQIDDLGDSLDFPNSLFKGKIKKNYRNYLMAHINSLIESYVGETKKKSTYGTYEPFFIPDGYLGISGKLDYKDWKELLNALKEGSYGSFYFSYQNLTKSRIYSDFADSLDQHTGISTENTRVSTVITGLLGLSGVDEVEERRRLQDNFENNLQKNHTNYYVCKKIETKDTGGYLNVMEKLPDYKFGVDDESCKFPKNIAKKLSFTSNTNELTMTIADQFKSKNLTTGEDGFFNFATFERTGDYSYGTAKDRRAGLEFDQSNVKSSLTATSIDIKGTVGGTGSLRTTTGDIIFEAIGSGISQKENLCGYIIW